MVNNSTNSSSLQFLFNDSANKFEFKNKWQHYMLVVIVYNHNLYSLSYTAESELKFVVFLK